MIQDAAAIIILGIAIADRRVPQGQIDVGIDGHDAEFRRLVGGGAANDGAVALDDHVVGDDRQPGRPELLIVGRGQHKVAAGGQRHRVRAVDVAIGTIGPHLIVGRGAGVDDGFHQRALVVVDDGHLAVDDGDRRLGRVGYGQRGGQHGAGEGQQQRRAADGQGQLAPQLPPPGARQRGHLPIKVGQSRQQRIAAAQQQAGQPTTVGRAIDSITRIQFATQGIGS